MNTTDPRAATATVPPWLPEPATRSWTDLGTATDTADAEFDPDSVDTLPAPVARWLRHAIAPGSRLRSGVQLSMHGRIRI
jgi:hypothetical protein